MNGEQLPNAHAHVLGMLLGEGDPDFVGAVSRKVEARNVLYVGLTETTPFETAFIARHRMAHIGPEALADTVEPVLGWLRATGKKHVAVHFDLDVLDPRLYDFLYFNNPDAQPNAFDGIAKGRLTMDRVQAILHAVAVEAEIVGLAITEYLPWSAIRLANQLSALPLLGDAGSTGVPPLRLAELRSEGGG